MNLKKLDSFPKLPKNGLITVCEAESYYHLAYSTLENPADTTKFTNNLEDYHHVNGDSLKNFYISSIIPSISHENPMNLLLYSPKITFWNIWRDDGWIASFKYALSSEKFPASLQAAFTKVDSVFSKIRNFKKDLVSIFYPHLALKKEDLIELFSPVRSWKKSWVRAMAWHPQYSKLAIVLDDDSIRILTNGEKIISIIKSCPEHKNVTNIAWRPYLKNELVIGVEGGIIFLQVDDCFKPNPGRATFFDINYGHSPVSHLEYISTGSILLTASPVDSIIYAWETKTWTNEAFWAGRSGGYTFLKMTKQGDKMIAASTSSLFRLCYPYKKWESKRWTTPGGRVEAACWSPCGNLLLFASGHMLYLINFNRSHIDFLDEGDATAIPIFDLACTHIGVEQDFPGENELLYKCGGTVKELLWDPTGDRIVILFEDSEIIPVFKAQIGSNKNHVTPSYFIRGHNGEFPLSIAFQNNFNRGALLTIAWSSGRLQYFPMIFATTSFNKNILHQDNWGSTGNTFQKLLRERETGARIPTYSNANNEAPTPISAEPNLMESANTSWKLYSL